MYEVSVLDSTQFEPKSFAGCDSSNDESFDKFDCSDFREGRFDMKVEQIRDDDISEIRSMILNDKESKNFRSFRSIISW